MEAVRRTEMERIVVRQNLVITPNAVSAGCLLGNWQYSPLKWAMLAYGNGQACGVGE